MPKGSLLTIFRSKQDGRRSRSSPPTNRVIDWNGLPPEYMPAGQTGVRILPVQSRSPPTKRPVLQVSQSMKREVQKMNKQSSVLLQLPPRRAMWRRSLEDLSPTKTREWLKPEDFQRKQLSVDIACAMPPDFFDRPSAFTIDCGQEISPMSDEDNIRAYAPASSNVAKLEGFRQAVASMPTFTPTVQDRPRRFTETEYQIATALENVSPDVTIDRLLSHPMLRTSG